MLAHDFAALPVVDPQDHNRLVGVLGRSDVLRARLAYVRDETQRERSLRLGLRRHYRPVSRGYDERVRETDALAHAEQSSFDLTAPGTGAPPAESDAIAKAAATTATIPEAPETTEAQDTTSAPSTEPGDTSSNGRPHSSP